MASWPRELGCCSLKSSMTSGSMDLCGERHGDHQDWHNKATSSLLRAFPPGTPPGAANTAKKTLLGVFNPLGRPWKSPAQPLTLTRAGGRRLPR